jgi:hypothetical protein
VEKILELWDQRSIVKTFFVNTASVKSAHAMSTWLFTYSSIKEHLTLIEGLEGNKSYNR